MFMRFTLASSWKASCFTRMACWNLYIAGYSIRFPFTFWIPQLLTVCPSILIRIQMTQFCSPHLLKYRRMDWYFKARIPCFYCLHTDGTIWNGGKILSILGGKFGFFITSQNSHLATTHTSYRNLITFVWKEKSYLWVHSQKKGYRNSTHVVLLLQIAPFFQRGAFFP